MKYRLFENVILKKATIHDLSELINFQSDVMMGMEKEFYKPLTKEEFLEIIVSGDGEVIIIYYDNELIGIAVLNAKPQKEVINKYKLEDSKQVGIYDSVMVKKEYRGSKLQVQMTDYIDNIAENRYHLKALVATVHPDNIWSKNNFELANYKELKRAYIHNGPRIIYMKDFATN